jgi:hypothetical protein
VGITILTIEEAKHIANRRYAKKPLPTARQPELSGRYLKNTNVDKFAKNLFNVWIPAFAGMTDSVSD